MNALATAEQVRGDFSGDAKIEYQGGVATFYTDDGFYYMRLDRAPITRVYRILRTVGSRFFQSYAGVLVEGPEPADHPLRTEIHHLPFSYWLGQEMWVPEVHVYIEVPDSYRLDVFGEAGQIVQYDKRCSVCHTTRPIGDWLLSWQGIPRVAEYAPYSFRFRAFDYLLESHPDTMDDFSKENGLYADVIDLLRDVTQKPASEQAITLGVSCEACHNGARDHILHSAAKLTESPPEFFPNSPHIEFDVGAGDTVNSLRFSRSSDNINWICARCHSGNRPTFAAGMSTWNSTEASDAFKGSCYESTHERESLTCVSCHNPHEAIGKQWPDTAEQDDRRCLKCHEEYSGAEAIGEHTHHSVGSSGARCMNCHMPKINEGLQDVVRTHMIFNPTKSVMLESNQPNACNLCHLAETIDWTLDYLNRWYGKTYDAQKIADSYPYRKQPAGLGWLKSDHEPTRLAAIDALGKAQAEWATSALIEALDDPFLVNRRLAQLSVVRLLNIKLEQFGYHHYQSSEQRRESISRIRKYSGTLLEE